MHAKIAKKKSKFIHPAHNPKFNHNIQLEIGCIEWAIQGCYGNGSFFSSADFPIEPELEASVWA
jgi:hypothetical protein